METVPSVIFNHYTYDSQVTLFSGHHLQHPPPPMAQVEASFPEEPHLHASQERWKMRRGEFLPQLENEKNNVLVPRGILENRQPMYREIASEDGSMNSILEVRSTYPKCRHPECLEVKIGCLEPAGFHSSQLLQYLTRTTTKWPAGTTDVGRELAWPSEELQAPEAVEGDAGHGGDRGVEGVGMRVTSGGATRIWRETKNVKPFNDDSLF